MPNLRRARIPTLVSLGFGLLLVFGLAASLFLLFELRSSVREGAAIYAATLNVRASVRGLRAEYIDQELNLVLLTARPGVEVNEQRVEKLASDKRARTRLRLALASTQSEELRCVLRELQQQDEMVTDPLEMEVLELARTDLSAAREMCLTRYLPAQRKNLELMKVALRLATDEVAVMADRARARAEEAQFWSTLAIAAFLCLGIAAALFLTRAVAVLVRQAGTAARETSDLMDHSMDIICSINTEGRFTKINGACESAWGYRPEELVGRTTIELVHPEDVAQTLRAEEQIIAGTASGHFENRCCRKDGSVVNMRWSMCWSAERQTFFCVAHDITERKLAEAAVQRNQRHLRGLIDGLGPSMFVALLTPEGILIEVNAAPLAAAGLKPEDVLGKPFVETHWWANSPEARQQLRKAIVRAANGEASRYDVRTQGVGDDYIDIDFSLQPLRDETGAVVFLVPSASVITERTRAEEALRESKRMLEQAIQVNQQVLDHSLDVVCTVDAAGRFASVSAACEKLFGYSPAEMVGRPFLDFLHAEDRDSTIAETALLPTGHELHDYQNRYVRKDGMIVTISWSATWSDADQSIFCVGRDCTERKQAEEAQAARQAAERANIAKSEFLSRMSHELRTPMNAILGFAQVLETDAGLTADQRDSVDHILKGGGHLLKLINEVLDISSIEAGRMTLSSEPIALPALLEEIAGLLRPLSADFNVRIAVILSTTGHVLADRQRLKQVLLNLLGNAIKYNRPGGSVTVRYEKLGGPAGGGSPAITRLSVTDTGAGLCADRLARLFNPFERLGAEQTPVEGTGLGLVLARRMVEHMGGTLGVESVVGEGSTFWVELPTAESPIEHEEEVSDDHGFAVAELSAEARVVLYIEDNPSNVHLVGRILARRPGIQLLSAGTGALGLEMARAQRPDLILLDLHLPDSHGDEVLARLAADPRTGVIPVVMLSADALPGKRADMLAAGARAFMTKPLDVRNFVAVVDQFLAPQAAAPA